VDTPFTLRHFKLAVSFFAGALGAGTVGFWFALEESFVDSFYRATVTISLSGIDTKLQGVDGRLATILLIFAGMAIYGYLASAIVELIAHGVLTGTIAERRRRRTIEQLRDHYIICGFGRVGQRILDIVSTHGGPDMRFEEIEVRSQKLLALEELFAPREAVA
jgi:voltage-gated potassium channel